MKRLLVLAIFICMLVTGPVLALEGVYPQVCPVNYAVTFDPLGDSDSDFLHLTLLNATDHPITYLEFSVFLFDRDGQPAMDGITNYFHAHVPEMLLKPHDSTEFYWSMEAFPSAAEAREFRMEKIVFQNGESWVHPNRPLYAQPFMYSSNPQTKDGSYILDSNRALTLIDYSYSSESRVWYIWNDGPGWVPFSRDIVANCQIWQPGAAIKLEINGQPTVEPETIFHVVPSPGAVAMHPYATGITTSVPPVLSFLGEKTAGDTAPVAMPNYTVNSGLPIGDVPLYIGLWDYTESESRTWSIWDGTEWVTFSYDRGPLCEIWRTGTIYLKLTYPCGEAVYALDVKGV